MIHLYKGNVTYGEKDGDLVSEGTMTNPVEAYVAPAYKIAVFKCAVRFDEGESAGLVTIKPTGTNADCWSLSLVRTVENWGGALELENVRDTNVTFWVKVRSKPGEKPGIDTSVKLEITAES